MKTHKKEIIILFGILLIGILAFVIIQFTSKTANTAIIQVDNQTVGEYDLNENQIIPIKGTNGLVELEIFDGTCFVKNASCPDKLCIHQGPISHTNEKIVCLPNKTVISIENDKESKIDGVVQ